MKTLTVLMLLGIGAAAFAQHKVEQTQRALEAAQVAHDVAENLAWQMAGGAPGMPMPGKMEKFTHCGIATTECPAVLSAQLKLTPGFGLVIDFVEPGSPADSAGLKPFDLLQKMNDQVLVNPEQLRALVRMKKPSDDARFTLLRQGQPMTINVELGQKEMPAEVEQPLPVPPGRMGMTIDANGNAMAIGGGGMVLTNINGTTQGNWSDDQNSIKLDLKDGKATHAVIKDNGGKELFNGPVETLEQRKAIPAELAPKLELAEQSMRGNVNVMWQATPGMPVPAPRVIPAPRIDHPRVVTSTEKDTLLVVRLEKNKPTWVFAFNTADGKTLFDGAVASDEQRKALPAALKSQLGAIEMNLNAVSDFGAVGR